MADIGGLLREMEERKDEAESSVGSFAALRNYFVVPLLVGFGFSLGMALGYEVFDSLKNAARDFRTE